LHSTGGLAFAVQIACTAGAVASVSPKTARRSHMVDPSRDVAQGSRGSERRYEPARRVPSRLRGYVLYARTKSTTASGAVSL